MGTLGRSIAAFSARRLNRGADISWLYRRPSLFYLPQGGSEGGSVFNTSHSLRLALRVYQATRISYRSKMSGQYVTGAETSAAEGGGQVGEGLRTERFVRYFTSLSGQNLISFYKSLSRVFSRAEKMTHHTEKREKTLSDLYFEMSRFSFPLQYTQNVNRIQSSSAAPPLAHAGRDTEITVVERSERSEAPVNINAILKSAMEMYRRETRSQRARRGLI